MIDHFDDDRLLQSSSPINISHQKSLITAGDWVGNDTV